jgi:hypothetical protein
MKAMLVKDVGRFEVRIVVLSVDANRRLRRKAGEDECDVRNPFVQPGSMSTTNGISQNRHPLSKIPADFDVRRERADDRRSDALA